MEIISSSLFLLDVFAFFSFFFLVQFEEVHFIVLDMGMFCGPFKSRIIGTKMWPFVSVKKLPTGRFSVPILASELKRMNSNSHFVLSTNVACFNLLFQINSCYFCSCKLHHLTCVAWIFTKKLAVYFLFFRVFLCIQYI